MTEEVQLPKLQRSLRQRKSRKEAYESVQTLYPDEFLDSHSANTVVLDHIQSYSAANYIGNKREIAEQLIVALEKHHVEYNSVFDAFSGSGVVSLLFALMGKSVTSNDLLTGSALQAECLLNLAPNLLSEKDWLYLIENQPPRRQGPSMRDLYPGWEKLLTPREMDWLDDFRTNLCIKYGNGFQVGRRIVSGKPMDNILSLDGQPPQFLNPQVALALYALIIHINSHCFVGGRYYNGQTLAKVEHRLEHQQNHGLEFYRSFYDHTAHPERLRFPAPLRSLQNPRVVYNCDIIPLLEAGLVDADLLYLDPPYGGEASDYVYKYQFVEEYLRGGKLSDATLLGGSRFDKKKGFAEEFGELLARCGKFPSWLISFNATSFAKLDDILEIVKRFRPNVVVEDTAKLYKYRKERIVATDKEFLILARV